MDALSLPPEAPLDMPSRPLAEGPRAAGIPLPGMGWRRLIVLGGAVALTIVATAEMWQVLALSRWTVFGAILTFIFALLFFWIALAFTSGLVGFLRLLGKPADDEDSSPPRSRTALLMPIHHESPQRLRSALHALRTSLIEAGAAESFDVFILSDTREAALQATELEVWRELEAQQGPRLYYRCRVQHAGRKAGNIAEWVRRFGGAYRQFLILDADSLMEARTLLRLVHRMENTPQLGLIQTLPLLHGGRTRFARLQQFASQVYGPVIAEGLAWWSGHEGNYWGHNAMIRTSAFAQAAGLPELPGSKPFGGDIMSHDFVEAALLRRAGWSVIMDAALPGSFEEGPPNLPEMAGRDRRWCQGNLQHMGLIATAGLHPISRLHLLGGICAYLNAPLWLGFLLLGLAVSFQARFLRPEYFPAGHALFPQWPIVDAERAALVFGGTLALLLAPKVMGIVAFSFASSRARGGLTFLRTLGAAAAEILVSALLSPVTMLTQTGQCLTILRGADGGWAVQQREAEGWGLRASLRLMRVHLVFGLLLTALALAIDARIAAWLSPVLIGLVLAPWLVAWSSRQAGPLLAGILRTPLEESPQGVLLVMREIAPPDSEPAAVLEHA